MDGYEINSSSKTIGYWHKKDAYRAQLKTCRYNLARHGGTILTLDSTIKRQAAEEGNNLQSNESNIDQRKEREERKDGYNLTDEDQKIVTQKREAQMKDMDKDVPLCS